MLAPRKTLWSTPLAVIDKAIELVQLDDSDCVLDIGCGDGRVILRWAEHCSSNGIFPTFEGFDVDEARINSAKKELALAVESGKIDSRIRIIFNCENALAATDRISTATVIFLYLIPRGLRIIEPLIEQHASSARVVTYMSPLPNHKFSRRERVKVPHQNSAEWPLYFYRFSMEKL